MFYYHDKTAMKYTLLLYTSVKSVYDCVHCLHRYCDYLYGTIASDAPLFAGVCPQQPSGKQPPLPARSGKKKSPGKAKAAKESVAEQQRLYLGYVVQEVTFCGIYACIKG